jgi:type IV secretory pathway protease TraF
VTRVATATVTCLTTLAAAASVLVDPSPRLIWNASASVPTGLYAVRPVGDLHVTELVVVRPPAPVASFLADSGYLPRRVPLLKRVLALPGQTVCRDGLRITVDRIVMGSGARARQPRTRSARLARLPDDWARRGVSHELAVTGLPRWEVFRAASCDEHRWSGRACLDRRGGMTMPPIRNFWAIQLFGTDTRDIADVANGESDSVLRQGIPARIDLRPGDRHGSASTQMSTRRTTGLARAGLPVITLMVTSALLLQSAAVGAESLRMLGSPTTVSSADPFAAFIAEASRRFGVPQTWIRAVMHRESTGDVRARSPKGAIGLMQIMPETWADLRVLYHLGTDPWDPRDNILAGAAYLQELHLRYGSPGFLGAYNAGPRRYEHHLKTGRPLPAETQAYVSAVMAMIDGQPAGRVVSAALSAVDWKQSTLFVEPVIGADMNGKSPDQPSPAEQKDRKPRTSVVVDLTGIAPRSDGLFVVRPSGDRPK